MSSSLGPHHIFLRLTPSSTGHYLWQWREQSRETSESGGINVPRVFWRDINSSYYTPPLHCTTGLEETTNTALTSSHWLWNLPVTHFQLPMAELFIRLELANAKARRFTGSFFLRSLQPHVSHLVPPTEGTRFPFCFSKCTLCWGCCLSGLSHVWEICEGALSTHSPPPSEPSSPAGDTHLLYGMLPSLPLSVSMASTMKRFSSDCQHFKPPPPQSTASSHSRQPMLLYYFSYSMFSMKKYILYF